MKKVLKHKYALLYIFSKYLIQANNPNKAVELKTPPFFLYPTTYEYKLRSSPRSAGA